MNQEDYDFLMESSFIDNVNNGVVLDNSEGAKRQAQGMAFNTGQMYNDVTNYYSDNTSYQSNYMNPNQAQQDINRGN